MVKKMFVPESIKRGYPRAAVVVLLLLTACGDEVPTFSAPLAEALNDTAMEHAAKHLNPKYVCPMHPQIVRDEPGRCPICGMNLVEKRVVSPRPDPLREGEADGDRLGRNASEIGEHPEVALSAAVVHNMGVRSVKAERGTLWKYIRTVGRVEYDETRLAHVHPRAEGWIEDLSLRAEGEPVRKGQELAQLYAPDILSAQVDFLLALEPRQPGVAGVRADKARNLLRLLDVPDAIIGEIERTRETRNRIPVLAPIDGIVTGMMARDGMYLGRGMEMFTIADLSHVWVMVDVFEHQIDWLKPGLSAEIQVPAHPGKKWDGVVDYLYPDLDPKTRTLRVRLVFPNPDLLLKPNMFAEVAIHGGPKKDVLKIPSAALIVTGERNSVVTALGKGRFQPVDVIPGMQEGGEVEILAGLSEGDEIVVSGQFLIDSESSLQASFMRMSGPGDASAGNAAQQSSAEARLHHER
jgi:Cu(I)/Ag(I) efflux system membrane fusion protein